MQERPIIFSPPMVKAILDGKKMQTRRVMQQPDCLSLGYIMASNKEYAIQCGADYPDDEQDRRACPYGVPGDRLWVREAWQALHWSEDDVEVAKDIPETAGNGCYWQLEYRADGRQPLSVEDRGFPWRSPIHLPRRFARIVLEVKDVRVQQVQQISAIDAMAEGVQGSEFWAPKELEGRPFEEKWWDDHEFWARYPQMAFHKLWDWINGKEHPWQSNPWVWVIAFERV